MGWSGNFVFLNFVILILALPILSSAKKTSFSYDGRALKINGDRKIIISGSIHYPHSTPEVNFFFFSFDINLIPIHLHHLVI